MAEFVEVGSRHSDVGAADRVRKRHVSEVPIGSVQALDDDDVLFVAERLDFAGLTVAFCGTDRHSLLLKGLVTIENVSEPYEHALFV